LCKARWDLRRKPTEHRVGTAGRKTVRDWQGGPDELDERIGLLATVQQSATQNTGLQNASGESNVVPAVLFGVFYS
jgi:hypothetical protein